MPGYLEAVQAGHHQIQQQDVRLELLRQGNGFPAVGRFADDFKIGFGREQGAQALSNHVMIIDQQDRGGLHG